MPKTAADVMKRDVETVSPAWSLIDLERGFVEKRVSGFPVVEQGRLVGVVSRTDVLQQLDVERSRAGSLSDYFRSDDESPEAERASVLEEEDFVSSRMAGLAVRDVMSEPRFVAAPETSVAEVAALMVRERIHRLPVVEDGALVGILSSLDLIAVLAAEG